MTNTALRDLLAGMMAQDWFTDRDRYTANYCTDAIAPAVAELIEALEGIVMLNPEDEMRHAHAIAMAALSTFQARASQDGEG